MNEVPRELIDFIKSGKKFIVAGHKESDGDCVGSQLALCSILGRMGKEAIPCSPGPLKRHEVKQFEKLFRTSIDKKTREGAWAIITDCSSMERTGELAGELAGLPIAIIDHHEHGKDTPEQMGGPVYISETAASVTQLILKLIDALGMELTKNEADFLFFGLCTDTGFFRHVDSNGVETFETAVRLVKAGANPKKTYQMIHGGKSLESRLLIGHILSRAEPYLDGRLLISSEDYDDNQHFGIEGRDSDVLYQLLMSVGGVQAIAVIRQEKPDACTVSLRSLDKIDVAAVAQSMGGGGHRNAAGVNVPGTIGDIREKLLELFRLHLS